MGAPFGLLDPRLPGAQRQRFLLERQPPAALGDHWEAARTYQPDEDLVTSINVALTVSAPLLLTGDPGTGKTQVAYYLAYYFGLDPREQFFKLDVRSSTTSEDLLYRFDHVAYFHAANQKGEALSRRPYVRPGPLWEALACGKPCVLLIDEIDKAPRDLPNDLLGVLDQGSFDCPEHGGGPIRRPAGAPAPIVVITSNSERRLPEPFLRRCVFHHIELTSALLRRAVAARRADYPGLSDAAVEEALARFLDLRNRPLRKKPATAELLVWLTVLSAQGVDAARLRDATPATLPALAALIKDRDDRAAL